MKPDSSVKGAILSRLRDSSGWVTGGILEREVGERLGCKPSNVSRRLRELEVEGRIDRDEQQIDGKGPHFVVYRYRVPIANKIIKTDSLFR